jgi:DsbC/DsbD-like thiol-disulfide interchange protein
MESACAKLLHTRGLTGSPAWMLGALSSIRSGSTGLVQLRYWGKSRIFRCCLFAFSLATLLLAAGRSSFAFAEAGSHGNIELISATKSIQPGRRFWVGLKFDLEPHWHIYWVNPGDSGEPPKLEWHLPPGFRAGPIEWPVPERLANQSIVDYGYQGQVLLTVPIHPPVEAEAAEQMLGATVRWLVCRELCIPAKADVVLSLPVENKAPTPDPRWRELFDRTRARLPKPVPPNWKPTAVLRGDQFLVTIRSGPVSSQKPTFFPLVAMQVENSAPQNVTSAAGELRFSLRKSEQLSKPVTSLKGVVVFGPERAFLVDAPVTQSPEGARPGRTERRNPQ